MDYIVNDLISLYFKIQEDVFTVDDLYRYLKENDFKVPKQELFDILHISDYVFPLVNNYYVTRAGAFTGRWFSFKPSKEEVEKGYFILGHRCMPFSNPEFDPDSFKVQSKGKRIRSKAVNFSMNLALDTFALFGEGYVIPTIFNDRNNKDLKISSVQYSLPTNINLTAWPIDRIAKKEKFKYGDRILCRIIDWVENVVEVIHQPKNNDELIVSETEIQRETWYKKFENELLQSFERHGPTTSIETQLAYLFLENQEVLCEKNCGSCEEFMAHTSKIGIVPYGVETRIWYSNSIVPFVGPWNNREEDDLIMNDVRKNFSPLILDSYIKDSIYKNNNKSQEIIVDLVDKIVPQSLKLDSDERKLLLLNIEKRRGILKKEYNRFSDYLVGDIRNRALDLFTQISTLFYSIGCSGIRCEEFPQQELVVLSQLYKHSIRLIEELENPYLEEQSNFDDVSLSMDGMYDTFDDISGFLSDCLERNRYKGFGIITSEK